MLTGQTFEVKGFHYSLEAIHNISFGTNFMAWTDPQSGNTYILIYNESLAFGNDMDHSLINLNSSILFDILVWENPYDCKRPIRMETGYLFIPFQTEGSNIFFNNHYPSSF